MEAVGRISMGLCWTVFWCMELWYVLWMGSEVVCDLTFLQYFHILVAVALRGLLFQN